MQQRDQAVAAAHEVLEQTISSTAFFETPEAPLAKPCGAANAACVDVNADGKDDIKVVLTPQPTCVKVAPIKQSTLDLKKEDDRNCSLNENQVFGIEGAATGDSECSNSTWDIHAVATDMVTNTTVEVVQGVAVRVPTDDTTTSCPAK
jgi:hypothetical protein